MCLMQCAWDRIEAQARNKSGPARKMAVLFGPNDVQEGRDVIAGPKWITHGYVMVPPEALEWLSQSCGLRSCNMTPIDLKLANTPLFLPYIEKGGDPIEDATVCDLNVGLSCMCSWVASKCSLFGWMLGVVCSAGHDMGPH